jgi:hypothetical protein
VTSREYADENPGAAEGSAYSSLEAAFVHQKTPLENQAFVRQLLSGVSVDAFFDRGSYIKATRADGGPAVQIHYGYSNGFRSEEEITRSIGDVDRWRSGRATNLWGVSHPENKIRSSSGGGHAEKREWGYCTTCGLKLPASGLCDMCD